MNPRRPRVLRMVPPEPPAPVLCKTSHVWFGRHCATAIGRTWPEGTRKGDCRLCPAAECNLVDGDGHTCQVHVPVYVPDELAPAFSTLDLADWRPGDADPARHGRRLGG